MRRGPAAILRLLVCLLLLAGAATSVAAVTAPEPVTPGASDGGDLILPGRHAGRSRAEPIGPAGSDPTLAVPGERMPDGGAVQLTLSTGEESQGYSNVIKIMLLITVLAVAPGFLVMMTSFTRIVIVLGFVRKALGTQTLPPNQIVLGLSLFLSLFVMAPTFERIHSEALKPYLDGELTEEQAFERAGTGIKEFMGQHTRKRDLALFIHIAGGERPRSLEDVPLTTLVPAFITSELKTAFQMGFVLFVPFLLIDLIVAGVLMALGMMMLPPIIISLPFKILLFVIVDGWALLVQSLAASYA